jgi:hypothetical protein
MLLSRYLRVFLIFPVVFVVGCAQQPLSSIDRNNYKTVCLDPNLKAPNHYVYRDITGKRSRGVMSSFGLAGAVVGLMAGAASESPGYHRFDAAASKHPIDIRVVVRREMENALRSSKLLQVVPANADTTLKIEIQGYGVGPVNDRELGGMIAARTTLTGRNGAVIWKKDEWAVSNTTALLEGIEANPALWPRMANEAAQALAKRLLLVTTTTKRTAAEPFM